MLVQTSIKIQTIDLKGFLAFGLFIALQCMQHLVVNKLYMPTGLQMKKLLLSALLTASAVIAAPAHAYVINFDFTNTNVTGGDFSGKTSPLLGAENVAAPGSQLFIETFGAKTAEAIRSAAAWIRPQVW